MSGFFKGLFGRVLTPESVHDRLYGDDGGLSEFAELYGKELAEKTLSEKRFSVSALELAPEKSNGRNKGFYLLDTSDFQSVVFPEIRASIKPICRYVLKRHCTLKGGKFLENKSLFAFYLNYSDKQEELRAALAIVDTIAGHLLGYRYFTGDKAVSVPLVNIAPESVFGEDGSLRYRKAKAAVKLARDCQIHGPALINWKEKKARAAFRTMNAAKPEQKKSPDQAVRKLLKKSRIQGPLSVTLGVLGEITLVFRPTVSVKSQKLDTYCGVAYRKTQDAISLGREIYDVSCTRDQICMMDHALAAQAARYIDNLDDLEGVQFVLSFHVLSLSLKGAKSPLSPLQRLSAKCRKHIRIEVLGLDPSAAQSQLDEALAIQGSFFERFIARIELNTISKRLELKHKKLQFISCDLEETANRQALRKGIAPVLDQLKAFAGDRGVDVALWGVRNRADIASSLARNVVMLNGSYIAHQTIMKPRLASFPLSKYKS